MRVPYEDVDRVAGQFVPGHAVSFVRLYAVYERMRQAEDLPVASSRAFARALTREGWQSLRKRRGSRGKQVETTYRVIPGGGAPVLPADLHMREVLRRLGPGIHPADLVMSTYRTVSAESGTGDPMGRYAVMRWMTEHGYPQLPEGRYVA